MGRFLARSFEMIRARARLSPSARQAMKNMREGRGAKDRNHQVHQRQG